MQSEMIAGGDAAANLVEYRGQDAATIRAAASELKASEKQRLAKAKAALAAEEKREAAVQVEAEEMDKKAQKDSVVQEIDAAAEKQYEAARAAAISKAAKTIEHAREAKDEVEEAAKQKLGANNDKFLDMNPPTTPQKDPFSDLDPPVVKASGKDSDDSSSKVAKKSKGDAHADDAAAEPKKEKSSSSSSSKKGTGKQSLGANHDPFMNMQPPKEIPITPADEEEDPFANLDPPIVNKAKRVTSLSSKKSKEVAREDAKVASLEKQLKLAKSQAKKATQQLVGSVADWEARGPGADRNPPTFYEGYKPGMKGPMADSKWVPADHPEGHKKCKLHDIDCDELWPWGKISREEMDTAPLRRHGPLGDNLVGVFGQDDVVVPTEDSGITIHGKEHVEKFGNWPVNSKKNKDLLYGNARFLLADKYLGLGDRHVKRSTAEKIARERRHNGQSAMADLMFGSWEQGFHKPHTKSIKDTVNMFDQPYRQHWSVAKGKGHQVFKHTHETTGPTGRLSGPTRGDSDDEDA